jgi:hypothetical protein
MWSTGNVGGWVVEGIPVAGRARQPAFADLDGNGESDLVVATETAGVSVLLRSHLEFEPRADYEGQLAAEGIAVSDLDSDGALDLLVAANDGLAILLGRGDGTFAPAVECPLPGHGQTIVSTDLDGDGRPDVAVLVLADDTTELLVAYGVAP